MSKENPEKPHEPRDIPDWEILDSISQERLIFLGTCMLLSTSQWDIKNPDEAIKECIQISIKVFKEVNRLSHEANE